MSNWNFGATISKERADALLARRPFTEVVECISKEMEILCRHYQVCDEHTDFSRVVYCIRVCPDTFDQFYNSPYGYRGTYFRDPYDGLKANANLIQRLSPQLLAKSVRGASQAKEHFISESLTSPSAKVWLAENGLHLCHLCEGEWGNPLDDAAEILNGRWDKDSHPSAVRGRKAPRLTKIRIFGAFLDERHNELVPSRKRHRALHLHQWGWS